ADRTVSVGDDVYSGSDVILATGSYSRSLPGLEIGGRILTSEQALALDVVPERVLVLGGGVIGGEFASVWRSFGAEVTIIEALPHLVPNEDIALSKGLERASRRRGIKYSLGTRFQTAEQDDTSVTVTLEDGTSFSGDYLLVAVGRGPVTSDLGFEAAGVTLERGFVTTDERLPASAPHVWAVGDIVPGHQLAHRGLLQGIAHAQRIAALSPAPIPESQIPKITYCNPEVASVGLTEEAAVAAHGADGVTSYEYNLAGNGKSEIIGTGGLVKVVRLKDGPVLGVHLLG